jgi:hypothetical protein
MTIYSRHANRGKVQILATYNGSAGVISSTVTSVDDSAIASLIVDALNRISSCATVPVSVRDERTSAHARYPHTHLEAITDRDRRAELLTGAHSLWYEYAKLLLHRALTDLDAAIAPTPAPVQTAIEAELGAEVLSLWAALREFEEGSAEDDAEPERRWDFETPFVPFEGGMDELGVGTRDELDRAEEGLSTEQLEEAVSDLRLLRNAYMSGAGGFLLFEEGYLSVSDDPGPDGSDRYFLDIQAPLPSDPHRPPSWAITINRWDIDLDALENEGMTATGEAVLDCSLPDRPTESELIDLLSLSGRGQQEQLSAWAKTPVGATLKGTPFAVTRRYDR